MPASADAPPRWRLAHKLALAKVAIAAILAVLLLLYVGPATTADFLRTSGELLQRSVAATRDLAHAHTEASQAVLTELIAHTSDARHRALADLPLDLYAGDVAAIRKAMQQDDERRGARLGQNATTLASEMQRRADRHIDSLLAELQQQQGVLAGDFASELRRSHLWLCGAVIAVGMLVLGFGLLRFVVRPAMALRAATQRIASGDLSVTVTRGADDEIGALAGDFTAMVQQLRESRAAIAQLTTGLEREVSQKTAHLQQALADLQRTHKELLQSEKMASIGTLAGGVAHEFNNLIGGIRGCAAEARVDQDEPSRRETLDVILRAADRATAITQQLLRFAKPAVSRTELVDVATVVDDALRLVEPEARRRQVAVVRNLTTGGVVRGDADALHQVFVNLLTNALQAMPAGGTLTVAVDHRGDRVVASVTDTGLGIAADDLDHIFEPFFSRRDAVADPSRRGAGLGLSVSYGIVDAHGGRITVESQLGVGTTFGVSLPPAAMEPTP